MSLFFKRQKNKPVQKSWQRDKSKAYSANARKKGTKRKRKFSRFLFWFLLLLFVGICGYLLLFSPFLDINIISIEGNQDTSSVDITNAVKKSLDGKIFGYLPRKNFFLASKKNISNAVQSSFSRIEVESINKKFPETINLRIVERKAELVWCSGGVCYFVDKSGLAYTGASGTEEELRARNFLVVVDDSAIPVNIRETRIDPEFIKYVESANKMIRDGLNLGLAGSYHTPAAVSREISVSTEEGWILKLSPEYSIDEMKKIIQTFFEKDLNKEARKNLEYLDLRVQGKVYYKMK